MGVTNQPAVVDMDKEAMVTSDTPVVTWTTRRKIAWVSMWSIVAVTGILILIVTYRMDAPGVDKMRTLETIYTYFLGFMCSIVLGYFGSTTLPYVGKGIFGRGDPK